MNDTKKAGEAPGLFVELMSLLERCEPAFGQKRVFNRVLALVMAEIFTFGRHTVTQLLLTLGLTDEDWSAWYRIFSQKRFEEEKASAILLKEMIAEVPEGEPFVVGEDGFPVPRCSLKMPGSGWMRGLADGQVQARHPTRATICRSIVVAADGERLQSSDTDSLSVGLYRKVCCQRRWCTDRGRSSIEYSALDPTATG